MRVFMTLHRARSYNMEAPNPITLQEIETACKFYGIQRHERLAVLHCISDMDAAFLEAAAEGRTKKCRSSHSSNPSTQQEQASL